jgi:hypothetical protein
MKEYEEVRSHLIEMLEELDERLTKITADVKQKMTKCWIIWATPPGQSGIGYSKPSPG